MRYIMQRSWYLVVVALALMFLATGPLAALPPPTVTFNLTGVGSGAMETLTALSPDMAKRTGFLTGGAVTPQARRFLRDHADIALEKPVELGKLRAFVQMLARRGGADSPSSRRMVAREKKPRRPRAPSPQRPPHLSPAYRPNRFRRPRWRRRRFG